METLNMNNKYLQNVLPEIVKLHLNTDIHNLKFIGGGSNGKVFRGTTSRGEAIAIKTFRVQGSQEEEASQLRVLRENTRVKMPEVLFTHSDENTAVMAMTFIEGSNVLNPLFLLKGKTQKEKFTQNVIEGMLQWHSVEGNKFGNLTSPTYDSWPEYYRKEKQEPWLKGLEELTRKGKYNKKSLKLLYETTELFNEVCREPEAPVLIHGDLNIMNIMADEKTFELTGFIDPCGSIWADREYDLFQLRNMWGDAFGLYREYKKRYPLSEYADFRVAYYASMHEAACRLGGGLIMPLWEELNNRRLREEAAKIKR